MLEWIHCKINKKDLPSHRAQGLVEFALILPAVLVSIFVLIEFARLFHAWLVIENGVRQGVRYAVVAEYNPAYCANGANAEGECLMESDEPAARIQSIHDVVWTTSSSIIRAPEGEVPADQSKYFNVLVCDPAAIVLPGATYGTHACPPDENPGQPGDKVVVLVEFNHPLIVPLLSSVWPQLRLTSMREATVETFRPASVDPTGFAFNSPTPIPTQTPGPTKTPQPTTGPSVPPLCFEEGGWYAFHHHQATGGYDYVSSEFHEGHGLPSGPMALNSVIIETVNLVQEVEKPARVTKVQVGWRNGTMQTFLWAQWVDGAWTKPAEYSTTIPIGIEMPYVYPDLGENAYRATYVTFYMKGELSGNYHITLTIYIPQYDHRCSLTDTYYLIPPTDEPAKPTDTPGPSPTPVPATATTASGNPDPSTEEPPPPPPD